MATTTLSFDPSSPIQSTTGTFYINSPTQENKIFFLDDVTPGFYYAVIRKEGSRFKFIQTGYMNGYYNPSTGNYEYSFDFDKYIRFEKVSQTATPVNTYFQYLNGLNVCDLTIATSGVEIISSNSDKIVTETNGDVYLDGSYTPSDLDASKYRYDFVDRDSSIGWFKPADTIKGTWLPVTVYGTSPINFTLYDINDNPIIANVAITVGSGYSYRVGLINMASNVYRVTFNYLSQNYTFYSIDRCGNSYYFMGKNGAFDLLHCTGVRNEVDNVTKDNIKIGNSVVVTKQTTVKQIKQNTGISVLPYTVRVISATLPKISSLSGEKGMRRVLLEGIPIIVTSSRFPTFCVKGKYVFSFKVILLLFI